MEPSNASALAFMFHVAHENPHDPACHVHLAEHPCTAICSSPPPAEFSHKPLNDHVHPRIHSSYRSHTQEPCTTHKQVIHFTSAVSPPRHGHGASPHTPHTPPPRCHAAPLYAPLHGHRGPGHAHRRRRTHSLLCRWRWACGGGVGWGTPCVAPTLTTGGLCCGVCAARRIGTR